MPQELERMGGRYTCQDNGSATHVGEDGIVYEFRTDGELTFGENVHATGLSAGERCERFRHDPQGAAIELAGDVRDYALEHPVQTGGYGLTCLLSLGVAAYAVKRSLGKR